MLLNFKRQFVPYILDGSKAHTIRDERKDGKRPIPGEILHLYTGLRQKGAEFILRAPCLRTEDIEFFTDIIPTKTGGCIYGPVRVKIAGDELTKDEMDALAWADGFRYDDAPRVEVAGSFGLMMQFWQGRLPFKGWITYWDYSKAELAR